MLDVKTLLSWIGLLIFQDGGFLFLSSCICYTRSNGLYRFVKFGWNQCSSVNNMPVF